MKLLNQTIKYLSVSILVIIGLWATVFYFNMLDEIKESVDEGLENYKRQIIYKVQLDTSILNQNNFDEGFFEIHKISQSQAFAAKDRYIDTLIYMQDADDSVLELEPVRMLTTVFENKGYYFELSIINPMVEEDDLIEEFLLDAIWLYLILVTSIIIINNYVLKRLWKPFYNFLNQLKNYRLDSNMPLPKVATNTREFNDLQEAVNTLLKHSIESYERQKQFIGNASHELQTPLAIAINKLELLVENGNLEDSQAESIAEIMNIVERLVRLNKSLLLLTKIENKQFFDNQVFSLNKITLQSLDDLHEMSEYKNITFQLNEASELFVDMDVSLANIIVSNLIKNAIFHNINGGEVIIDISEKSFKISNTGNNKSLNSDKLFTHFYKSETQSKGTGLGLAIVKAICDLYGYRISYHFENSKHYFELNTN